MTILRPVQFPRSRSRASDGRPMTTLAADWDELASADALWAVLSDPARKGGGWTREAFLESGTATVVAAIWPA